MFTTSILTSEVCPREYETVISLCVGFGYTETGAVTEFTFETFVAASACVIADCIAGPLFEPLS